MVQITTYQTTEDRLKQFWKLDVRKFNARDWWIHLGVLVNVIIGTVMLWYAFK